jgi:hypothetical protein
VVKRLVQVGHRAGGVRIRQVKHRLSRPPKGARHLPTARADTDPHGSARRRAALADAPEDVLSQFTLRRSFSPSSAIPPHATAASPHAAPHVAPLLGDA